jgi:hypothetical protein
MLDVFLWILVIAGGVGGIVVTHLTYLLVRGANEKKNAPLRVRFYSWGKVALFEVFIGVVVAGVSSGFIAISSSLKKSDPLWTVLPYVFLVMFFSAFAVSIWRMTVPYYEFTPSALIVRTTGSGVRSLELSQISGYQYYPYRANRDGGGSDYLEIYDAKGSVFYKISVLRQNAPNVLGARIVFRAQHGRWAREDDPRDQQILAQLTHRETVKYLMQHMVRDDFLTFKGA